MRKRRTIGHVVGPPRFLAFLVVLFISVPAATQILNHWALGALAGFDVAAVLFLSLSLPLLRSRQSALIEEHARLNDANRATLLVVTAIVAAVLLLAIAAVTVGQRPELFAKGLVITTLVLAWLFINTVYAVHYAHLAYTLPGEGCTGVEFPGRSEPGYWDFLYFAFTLGMTFQTSDVTITDGRIRRVVTVHCLAAFVFNIGVLAFTINVLGSD